MANETKIYVGEEGAKELYRHIKGLIPTVDDGDTLLEDSHNPVSSRVVYNALRNFGGFEPAEPTGEDHHPDVSEPSTKTIYLVELPDSPDPDHYMEWIWSQPEGEEGEWKCIGDISKVTVDSWKSWSSEHGSTADGDNAVFIGPNNTIVRDDTYVLGDSNTVETTDQTDYSDTDVVVIGTDNTATNAANAYQLGRENTVTGNNLANKLYYPHSVSVNIGRNNDIVGEGVNIGKENKSSHFGTTLGQNNIADNASTAIGTKALADDTSFAAGNGQAAGSSSNTVYNVPVVLVGNTYMHAGNFTIGKRYTKYDWGTLINDGGVYKWANVQEDGICIFPNNELKQYLVSYGASGSDGTVTGYYDENNNFIPSTDTTKDIHTYVHIHSVGHHSSSEYQVDFYANIIDNSRNYPFNCSINYLLANDSYNKPSCSAILNESQYEEFLQHTYIQSAGFPGKIQNLFVDESDLTAPAYKCNSLANSTDYRFPITYQLYGYEDDDGNFVPYNDLNKKEQHQFTWKEVNAEDITLRSMNRTDVVDNDNLLAAVNKSTAIGNGSVYSSGISVAIGGNTLSQFQTKYDNYLASHNRYSATYYEISQADGTVKSTSKSVSRFTGKNVTSWANRITPAGVAATNNSITISTDAATAYGKSISIGPFVNTAEKGYAFGESSGAYNQSIAIGSAAFGYRHSLALGFDNANAQDSGIAMGISGVSASNMSMALGFYGLSVMNCSLALSYGGYSNRKSLILGFNNSAEDESTSIGVENSARQGAVAIGKGNTIYRQNIGLGYYNNSAQDADNPSHFALLGYSNYSGIGGYNIGIGEYNTASQEGIAIGRNNKAYGWSIAMGVNNRSSYVAGGHATLIGFENISEYDKERISFTDDTVSSQYDIPMYTGSQYSLSEQLFLADELGTSGSINSIQLYCDSYPATRNIEVYLLNTTKSSFTSYSDWVTTSSSPVFSGNVTFYTGWNYINFTRTFSYGAGKNLLLIIVDKTGSYASPTMYMKGYTRPDYAQLALCTYRSTPISPSSITGESYVYMYTRSVVRFTIDNRTVGVPDIIPKNGYVYTNSVLMGNLNTARHYNSFLFGVGNYSYDALPLGNNSSDDGFVFAMGRENVVGRNYDFAYGYKSKASGGENIAFQHSTALGCRNFAMFDSSVNGGVLNIALAGSRLVVKQNTGIWANMLGSESVLTDISASGIKLLHNRLFQSDIQTRQPTGHNDFFNSTLDINCTESNGFYENIVAHCGTMDTYAQNRLKIDAQHTVDNVFIGLPSGSIESGSQGTGSYRTGAVNRNVILPCATGISLITALSMNDNLIHTGCGTLSLDNPNYFNDNVVLSGSSVSVGKSYDAVAQNVLISRSAFQLADYTSYGTAKATCNFLFNSLLSASTNQGLSVYNVLYSARASNIYDSFIFGFGDNAGSTYSPDQMASNAWRVVAFGDNSVYNSSVVFAFGSDNRISGTSQSIVMGAKNTLSGTNGYNGENRILGGDNQISAGQDYCSKNTILGNNNRISASGITCGNVLIGEYNMVYGIANQLPASTQAEISSWVTQGYVRVASACLSNNVYSSYASVYKDRYYYYYNGKISRDYYKDDLEKYDYRIAETATDISTYDLYYGKTYGTLTSGKWYHTTSGSSYSVGTSYLVLFPGTTYYYNSANSKFYDCKVDLSAPASRFTYHNFVAGARNYVFNNVSGYSILGQDNAIQYESPAVHVDTSKDKVVIETISNGLIQGSNNLVKNGSNIVCMGNGNVSTGHNSVAIGSQLISNQWQTVLGKYNAAIAGPNRLASETPQDPSKALLIVGNGYSTKDDFEWQDETYITRSNAMVVYADGTVTAHDFVSDNELTLDGQNGISVTDDLVNSKVVISLDSATADIINFLKSKPSQGTYGIQSTDGVLSWVAIGLV